MSKSENKSPVVAPIVTKSARGQYAPYYNTLRELCTGAGMTYKALMEATKLPEATIRRAIDGIRNMEGETIRDKDGKVVERTGTTKIFPNVGGAFQYRGLDGKGYKPAKG